MEKVHNKFKRNKVDAKRHQQYKPAYPNRIQLSLGICEKKKKKKDFRKQVRPGANKSYDLVGEFHGMLMFCFVFFWTFTRVRNCFYIKN